MILREIMNPDVHTISSEKSLRYAGEIMGELKIGSLVVVENEQVVGILTSRDCRSNHPNRLVCDAMTPNPVTIAPSESVFDAFNLMQQHQIERLIVMEHGKLAGIVTREKVVAEINHLIDPLTKLYRAPYIRHVTNQFLAKRQPFYFLFVDLNDFGEVNKEYGHLVGDKLIVSFAEHLRAVIGPNDHLCRYGGDEFAVVTPESREYAENLAKAISRPIVMNQICFRAAVGMLPGLESPVSDQPCFDDLLNQTSLIATSHKRNPV